jgi:hypothetical protein
LAGQLRQAEAVLTAPRPPSLEGVLADPLENLRWFQLPSQCLTTIPTTP